MLDLSFWHSSGTDKILDKIELGSNVVQMFFPTYNIDTEITLKHAK